MVTVVFYDPSAYFGVRMHRASYSNYQHFVLLIDAAWWRTVIPKFWGYKKYE